MTLWRSTTRGDGIALAARAGQLRLGFGLGYVALLVGGSMHHRSDELGDGAIDGPGDGRSGDGGVGGVPGLVLWLNGGAGVTHDQANRVSRWADQSGNQNEA